MTVDDLRSYQRDRRRLQLLEDKLERLQSLAEQVTQMLSLAPAHGDVADKLAAQIAEIVDFQMEITAKKLELEKRLCMIDRALDRLPEQQASVMRARYIDGLRWKDVAAKVHYYPRYCLKIHNRAIRTLKDTLFCDKL